MPGKWACPTCGTAIAIQVYRRALVATPDSKTGIIAYRCKRDHISLAHRSPAAVAQQAANKPLPVALPASAVHSAPSAVGFEAVYAARHKRPSGL